MKEYTDTVKKSITVKYDLTLIMSTLVILISFITIMVLQPEATLSATSQVQEVMLDYFGPLFLVFTFAMLIVSLYWAISKYGKIKLGKGDPEYSLFSYISMLTLAALASACLYWGYVEWAFYYESPGIGMEAQSTEALEGALGYQLFHWGISSQALYATMGVVLAYGYYVRKVPLLRTSTIFQAMMGARRGQKAIGWFVELCVVFGVILGLGVSLGLGIPFASAGLTKAFGINVTFPIQVGIVLVIAAVFTTTSFIGTKRGMKRISSFSAGLCIAFLVYSFLFGPTSFIIKNAVSSVGFMSQHFLEMSFFTDPIRDTGFAEAWTIFFQANYLNGAALMGLFIAKISKGRTLKQVIFATLFGVTAGGWALFMVNGGLSMYAHIEGLADIVAMVNSQQSQAGIYNVLELLPGGSVLLPIVILILIVGFLSSTLDTASFTLAQTTTKALETSGEPNRWLRVFWCVVLTLYPLSIMFVGANFDAIKIVTTIIAFPFMFILGYMVHKTTVWMKEDYNSTIL